MKGNNRIRITLSVPAGVEEESYIRKIRNTFNVIKVSKKYERGLYKRFYIDLK
ncbi:hypothetical protein [Clostridium sp.]|uniref:hypothetical protein n=1 Tax=Clostridium sp. TaxID=1506 RepID=UPI0035A0EE0E